MENELTLHGQMDVLRRDIASVSSRLFDLAVLVKTPATDKLNDDCLALLSDFEDWEKNVYG